MPSHNATAAPTRTAPNVSWRTQMKSSPGAELLDRSIQAASRCSIANRSRGAGGANAAAWRQFPGSRAPHGAVRVGTIDEPMRIKEVRAFPLRMHRQERQDAGGAGVA